MQQVATRSPRSNFNNFGLGDENKDLYYYPKYESFYDRINSCHISDDSNKILLNIKKGKDYVVNNNIKRLVINSKTTLVAGDIITQPSTGASAQIYNRVVSVGASKTSMTLEAVPLPTKERSRSSSP